MTTSDEARPVEMWPIGRLIPYAKNPKLHPPEEVTNLAKSMKRFGWRGNPIIVDKDGVIIAGHGRRLAALEAGLTKVPVDVARDWSKSEADAYRLADNRTHGLHYDMAIVQEELQRLAEDDIDLDGLGFADHELEFSTANLADMNMDAFVEDVSGAVESQQAANKKAAERIDDTAAPVADAIGFKRCTIKQSQTIRALMNRLEVRTGLTGPDALIKHLEISLA